MELKAKYSPFTTFCEGPENIEKGYNLFYLFHKTNYMNKLPQDTSANILIVSSGVGYFQYSLGRWGYTNVLGIDTDREKIAYAKDKGFNSECVHCFEYLKDKENEFDFIFVEQEVNHLTAEEFVAFLALCKQALKKAGTIIVCAANAANPLIATEYLGNNVDHYIQIAPHGMEQYLNLGGFNEFTLFSHDFYVIWHNPLNYVAKCITILLHAALRVVFMMYGKKNKIFTKRFGAIACKK